MIGNTRSTWKPTPPPVSRGDCAVCHGTGWELGCEAGVSRARPCSCRILDRLIRLKDHVRIPQRYAHCTLDGYDPLNFSQTRALAEMHKIAFRYPALDRDIFLAGGPGLGKTHLAVGLIRELMPKLSEDALFVDFMDLVRAGERAGPVSEAGPAAWARLTHCTVLLLDNFGSSPGGCEACALVQRLVEARWRLHRFTIFTGERLRTGALGSASAGASASATQSFCQSLPPKFLLAFLARVRFLSLVGEDYREGSARGLPLF